MLSLSVSVEGPPQQPIRVKQKAHIRFLVDGAPVPAVQISVAARHATVATLTSSDIGDLVLPELPPGVYALYLPRFTRSFEVCVVPCPDLGIETTVLVPTTLHGPLRVLDRDAQALSHVEIEIGLPKDPGWEKLFSANEESSILRVPALCGVVKDQSGAIIPNATIEVVAKNAAGKKQVVALLYADRIGRFSGPLPRGDYLALISAPGFRVRIIPVKVTPNAAAADLEVTLEMGSTS